jgi:hypothetical protein
MNNRRSLFAGTVILFFSSYVLVTVLEGLLSDQDSLELRSILAYFVPALLCGAGLFIAGTGLVLGRRWSRPLALLFTFFQLSIFYWNLYDTGNWKALFAPYNTTLKINVALTTAILLVTFLLLCR